MVKINCLRERRSSPVTRHGLAQSVMRIKSQIRNGISCFQSESIIGVKAQMVFWSLGLLYPRFAYAQTSSTAAQAGVRDFVEYWAASRLFLDGGNPYSPVELLDVQQSVGGSHIAPLIMWNPPWTLLFTLPFGLMSFTVAQFCWLLIHTFLILISAQQLWRLYGDSAKTSRIAWILVLTFVPTVFVLIIGQITPLILAGVTAFLYFERKQNWFAIGAAVLILSVKPHLLYLFWIVLLLWIWDKRQWRIIWASMLIVIIAVLFPLLFDSKIYSQYFALYQTANIAKPFDWPTPTPRSVIGILFGSDRTWLQFLPSVVAVAWVLYYWQRHKRQWCWLEQLPLLLLVSIASGFFAWTYDQVVLLPAIVEGAIWISHQSVSWYRFWAARVYIAINTCHLVSRFWLAEELWYFWLAPMLLGNYLIFRWESSRRVVTQKLGA